VFAGAGGSYISTVSQTDMSTYTQNNIVTAQITTFRIQFFLFVNIHRISISKYQSRVVMGQCQYLKSVSVFRYFGDILSSAFGIFGIVNNEVGIGIGILRYPISLRFFGIPITDPRLVKTGPSESEIRHD